MIPADLLYSVRQTGHRCLRRLLQQRPHTLCPTWAGRLAKAFFDKYNANVATWFSSTYPACVDGGRVGQCETDRALKGRDEQLLLNKTIIFEPRPVLHNLLLCHLAHEHFGFGATWKLEMWIALSRRGWCGLVITFWWSSSFRSLSVLCLSPESISFFHLARSRRTRRSKGYQTRAGGQRRAQGQ